MLKHILCALLTNFEQSFVLIIKKFLEPTAKFPLRKVPVVVVPPLQDVEDGLPHKILKHKIIKKDSKDVRVYLVRFKNKLADSDLWLEAKDIKNSDIVLRRYRASKRAKNSSEE